MKRLFPSTLLALALSVIPALPAAETKSAPPAAGKATAGPALAGEYAGVWKGKEESTGALRIKLKPGTAAAWAAEAWFTFEGAEVATTMKSIRVEGAKIEMVFGWLIQGTAAQSTLTGELTGDVLEGKYESTSEEGAASGTWKVMRS